MILCLETATNLCSVALCDRNGIIALRESGEERSHAASLTIFIGEVLDEAKIKAQDLEAVAVSRGPGSYTGLRIGVSAGKGIAYAASLPLIGIDTTFSMFHGFISSPGKQYSFGTADLFCPSLDARRMEIYYAVYDLQGKIIRNTCARIIDKDSLNDLPPSSRLYLFGDGALKCEGQIKRQNTIFDSSFRISAAFMRVPAFEAFDKRHFEDVAYFEPLYLKDFLATRPVKDILRQ